MTPRMNAFTAAPDTMQAMLDLEQRVSGSGLEPSLMELVKTRASQINGCAFCLHMHTRDARADGESEQRLYLLSAWRESPLYSERERAALAWTEALTRLADSEVTDEMYDQARRHFDEEELVKLTLLIGAINIWNRINVGFRTLHPIEGASRQEAMP
ncbi:carboxymuconolactone decarboxylase family protein [Halomonas organivorans]|uniref:AhpD family alkylhydroperoxidase n=1 Tax=Halomonas organivorans TaxID=257772 RepID=A0A7W5BXQ4_9GAMM|nr:carboxymuconolactone decarboxylase family protein [Halomonas organivorans]MBB3141087.1 AhpD family alkylhydroperoxidase [Halomonas organivorans]